MIILDETMIKITFLCIYCCHYTSSQFIIAAMKKRPKRNSYSLNAPTEVIGALLDTFGTVIEVVGDLDDAGG